MWPNNSVVFDKHIVLFGFLTLVTYIQGICLQSRGQVFSLAFEGLHIKNDLLS